MPFLGDVPLNHMYLIVEDKLYEDIRGSTFITQNFCSTKENTNNSGSGKHSWTGLYLMGKNTYIEFFKASDRENLNQIGIEDIGIAFSVDENKQLEHLKKRFQKTTEEEVKIRYLQTTFNKQLIPWFFCIQPTKQDSLSPYLSLFIMSYHPDYFKQRGLVPLSKKGISRKEYIKNCHTPYSLEKLFKDLDTICFLMDEEKACKFVRHQMMLGYDCTYVNDSYICKGSKMTFVLKLSSEIQPRITSIECRLNRNVASKKVVTIGSGTLTLEGNRAIWNF